jgi:hypothetical protein
MMRCLVFVSASASDVEIVLYSLQCEVRFAVTAQPPCFPFPCSTSQPPTFVQQCHRVQSSADRLYSTIAGVRTIGLVSAFVKVVTNRREPQMKGAEKLSPPTSPRLEVAPLCHPSYLSVRTLILYERALELAKRFIRYVNIKGFVQSCQIYFPSHIRP